MGSSWYHAAVRGEGTVKLLQVNEFAAAAVIAATLLGISCAPSGDGALRLPDGTPVVLISVDTLRSDHLPAYGYDAVDTPALDSFRADSVLFSRAYTQVPLTLPSHVSLLTGLLPPDHGVRDNLGYTVDAAATPMLQQRLGAAGYATGAGVSAFVLRRETGIAAGFDLYDDAVEPIRSRDRSGVQAVQRPGGDTLEAIRPWLRSVAGRPFFLLFHIFEPHAPYRPPPELAARYASPYDGEVAAADAIVGDLFDELRELEAYDRALIVFLSDHGEGLGDHGESEHGVFLYRSTLQVPLMVKLPDSRRAGDTVQRPVQLVDVVPTVLQALGLPGDDRLAGTSLLASSPPDPQIRPIFAETFYPRLHFGWSDLAAVIVGRHQLIDAPSPELYDLVVDPSQNDNLIGAKPELEGTLRTVLGRHDRTLTPPGAIDSGVRRRLEALGYVGGTSATIGASLPDPKDRVAVLSDIRDAHRFFADGDLEPAVKAFEAIVEREPGIEDAWEYLALSQIALGRPGDAAATYERACAAVPSSARLAMSAATLLFRMGRLDEAATRAELAVNWDPAAAHGLLAQIAAAGGDLAEAERQAQAALAVAGNRSPGAVLMLADILVARGRPDDAAEVLERAVDEGKADEAAVARLATIRLELGDVDVAEATLRRFEGSEDPRILVARGQTALVRRSWSEARGLFDRALSSDPSNAPARLGLGLLAVAEGRTAEGRTHLEAALTDLSASFEGWNALGMACARQGDDEAAIDAWSRARELRPDVDEVLFNLGLAYAQAGRLGDARQALEAYIARARPGPQRDRALAIVQDLS